MDQPVTQPTTTTPDKSIQEIMKMLQLAVLDGLVTKITKTPSNLLNSTQDSINSELQKWTQQQLASDAPGVSPFDDSVYQQIRNVLGDMKKEDFEAQLESNADPAIKSIMNFNEIATKVFEKPSPLQHTPAEQTATGGSCRKKKMRGGVAEVAEVKYQVADAYDIDAIYNVSGVITTDRNVLGSALDGVNELTRMAQPSGAGAITGSVSSQFLSTVTPEIANKYYGGGTQKKRKHAAPKKK